jgi:hypothetical protein
MAGFFTPCGWGPDTSTFLEFKGLATCKNTQTSIFHAGAVPCVDLDQNKVQPYPLSKHVFISPLLSEVSDSLFWKTTPWRTLEAEGGPQALTGWAKPGSPPSQRWTPCSIENPPPLPRLCKQGLIGMTLI